MTLYPPNTLFLGHPCERQPFVLHDPSNNWLLLRFHASCVHTSQLNRLCLRTPDGQRYGEKTTTKTHYIRAHSCFRLLNKTCVMFPGENGVCDEHPENSLCVSGHEHMGSSYVQSAHIPWLGETFKCFLGHCGYTCYGNYEYDRLENNYRDQYRRTVRPDSVYTVDIRLKRNGKVAKLRDSRCGWINTIMTSLPA